MAVQKSKQSLEYIEPIGMRVLVRKDQAKRETKGGIALPDKAEIPTITGRIVAISAQVANDARFPPQAVRQHSFSSQERDSGRF